MSTIHIKTFRAKTLQGALQQVLRELGPDAAILETKPLSPGLGRWLAGHRIEVTASSSLEGSVRAVEEISRDRIGRGAEWEAVGEGDVSAEETGSDESRLEEGAYEFESEDREPRIREERIGEDWRDEHRMGEEHHLANALMEDLRALGFESEVARSLLEEARASVVGSEIADELFWWGKLERCLQRQLRLGSPIEVPSHGTRPYVVALVGPSGGGKTTTLAKIAARFTLESRLRVGMLTCDTQRVGAGDRLKQYAQIMNLPCEQVESEQHVAGALSRLSSCALILVDTPGLASRDRLQGEHTRGVLEAVQPDEVHLVLSATMSLSALLESEERYGVFAPNRWILTKLDEAAGIGQFYLRLTAERPGLSYVTTGLNVPQDMEVGQEVRMAAYMLGQSRLPQ